MFLTLPATALLGTGQLHRFPAKRPLLVQDGERPKRIAAMQGQRMIEHMQDAQRSVGDRRAGIVGQSRDTRHFAHGAAPVPAPAAWAECRSEERRVGKECVGTWKYRGSP